MPSHKARTKKSLSWIEGDQSFWLFWMLLFKLTGVQGRMGLKDHMGVNFQSRAHQWHIFLVFLFLCWVPMRVGNSGVCVEQGWWASGCRDASLYAEDLWYFSRQKRLGGKGHGSILLRVIWRVMELSWKKENCSKENTRVYRQYWADINEPLEEKNVKKGITTWFPS